MDVGRVELYPASVRQGDDPELVEGVTVTGAPGLTAVLGEVAGPVAETPRPYGVGPRAEAPEGPSLKTSTARVPPTSPSSLRSARFVLCVGPRRAVVVAGFIRGQEINSGELLPLQQQSHNSPSPATS